MSDNIIINNNNSNSGGGPVKEPLKILHSLLDQTTLYTQFLNEGRVDKIQEPLSKRRKKDDLSIFNSLVSGTLRSYQADGVRWLVSLYENGLNGILADEMGLGKTIQLITFVAHLRHNSVQGPILICAPLSTLPQWQAEIEKWAPQLNSFVYHGSKQKRMELRREKFGKRINRDQSIIAITSYSIAMSDYAYLKRFQWKYLVIDEGHRLKNYDCKLLKILKQFPSDNRLLLTGTPLQNNLKELWSLLNFLLPDVFDSLNKFENWFNFDEKTLEHQQDRKVLLDEEKNNQIISKLHGILRPFILRRIKTDVLLDLPRKREIVLATKLTPLQEYYYQAIWNKERSKLPDKFSFHNRLMQLRKVCNHPFLIQDPDSTNTDNTIISCCGKLQLMDQLLKELKKRKHRVLIFSQMTRVLDILEDYLVMRDYEYCRFDGQSSSEERQDEVHEFNSNSNVFVFLLSTRSGGLGINLASADSVIIYDSDWNPFQDAQAQDRCHRIGQKNDVLVFRLITAHPENLEDLKSIEMYMLSRALSKKRLEQLVIGKGNLFGHVDVDNEMDRWKGTVKPLDIKQLEEELLHDPLARQNSNLNNNYQDDEGKDTSNSEVTDTKENKVTNTNENKLNRLKKRSSKIKPPSIGKINYDIYGVKKELLNVILNRDHETFSQENLEYLDEQLGDHGFVVKPTEVLADLFIEEEE